jgi:chorismate mutase/prephenate dehydratase
VGGRLSHINTLRKEIDKIDTMILDLLNKRAEIAIEIGAEKYKAQEDNFHASGREIEIYKRLLRLNKGPFPNTSLQAVYREILSATLSLEKPLTIAYLGPEGTFTHLAGLKQFGSSANYIPLKNIERVFIEVEKRRADYGVVPIENSTEGIVNYTLDMFIVSPLNICAEILLEISHNLLSLEEDIKKISKIYSHPHALAQCKSWLENNLSDISLCEVSSTARAAELASQEPSTGAIASESAATLYGLKVIERNISDNRDNFTRFIVISRELARRSGKDKTSILFSVEDKPGALFYILEPFAKKEINLTKIESRPMKKAWEYIFFLDMEGHISDKKIASVLDELREKCIYLKVLGSYPKYINISCDSDIRL